MTPFVAQRCRGRRVWTLPTHLREVGFDGAPRALGYDETRRQVLSFVEGLVDPDPSDLDVARVTEEGTLIRCLHDASNTFFPPTDATWNVAIAPDWEDLICHNDLAPCNLVRTPTQLTFIDWDSSGPGSRLWDLAYAAHGFVPLSPDTSRCDDVAGQRLAALVEGYDLDQEERASLLTCSAHVAGRCTNSCGADTRRASSRGAGSGVRGTEWCGWLTPTTSMRSAVPGKQHSASPLTPRRERRVSVTTTSPPSIRVVGLRSPIRRRSPATRKHPRLVVLPSRTGLRS